MNEKLNRMRILRVARGGWGGNNNFNKYNECRLDLNWANESQIFKLKGKEFHSLADLIKYDFLK